VLKNEEGLAIVLYRVCNDHGINGLHVGAVRCSDNLAVPEDYLGPVLFDLSPKYSSASEQLLSFLEPQIHGGKLLSILNRMDG